MIKIYILGSVMWVFSARSHENVNEVRTTRSHGDDDVFCMAGNLKNQIGFRLQ